MDLTDVQRELGVEFKDPRLLLEALTHSSCLNEPSLGLKKHNESLAWLGDALIRWIVSEKVYCIKLSTEELHDCREKFLSKGFLAGRALKYRLNEAMLLTDGQVREGGRSNEKNLHTVFEAIVGAIYMDKNFEKAKEFVLTSLGE